MQKAKGISDAKFIVHPKFPSKKAFGSNSELVIEERKAHMNQYFQDLKPLCTKVPKIRYLLYKLVDGSNLHRYAFAGDLDMVFHLISFLIFDF